MDPAPFWPRRPISPAELHLRERLLYPPSTPPPARTADLYRTRVLANRGSRNAVVPGASAGSRDGADGELQVGEVCALISRLLEQNEVHAAKLLVGELADSSIASVRLEYSRSVFKRELVDFAEKHEYALSKRATELIQRCGSKTSTGMTESESTDRRSRRGVSAPPAQSASETGPVVQGRVSRMFRAARSLSRVARRCSFSSSSRSATSQSLSFSSVGQVASSEGSAHGEGRGHRDVNYDEEARASRRMVTFQPVIPEDCGQEPDVDGQQRDGAYPGERIGQGLGDVSVAHGQPGSSQTSLPHACPEPSGSEHESRMLPGERTTSTLEVMSSGSNERNRAPRRVSFQETDAEA